MDFCEDINKAKNCLARMTHRYAKASTYGRNTPEALLDMKRMNAYIKTLERNLPDTRPVPINANLDGVKISFSSLRRDKNALILDTDTIECIEIRPCLSDDEICSIVELTQLMCSSCFD